MSGSYKDLDIYTLAHDVGVSLHSFSLKLPKHELYEVGSQLRRASKSISANIVEGYGRRRYKAEFIRFLIFAQASCDETVEWVKYIYDCHDNVSKEAEVLLGSLDKLGKKLTRFIQSVEKGHLSPK